MPETVPASRQRLIAIASGAGSPTASTTTSTPRPPVAARTAFFGSSSVRWTATAPNEAAISSRAATESIAKTFTAPPASAACTAQSPTGPRPRTATVSPDLIPAWATAW